MKKLFARHATAACVLVLLGMSSSAAQSVDLTIEVAKCRAIVEGGARLKCFDQIAVPALPAAARVTSAPNGECSPSGQAMKDVAQKILATNAGGDATFYRDVDIAFGYGPEDPPPSVEMMPTPEGLTIAVLTPYQVFRLALQEAIRKREAIAGVSAPIGVSVIVAVDRIAAPDIEKLILERDGKEVRPIENGLKPTTMQTRMGVTEVRNTGTVLFPCSAFAPGGTVKLIAIPRSGANITHEIPDLARERLIVGNPLDKSIWAISLVGKTTLEVEAAIGKPYDKTGLRWSYSSGPATLAVYFDQAGTVTAVQPARFRISSLKPTK